MAKRGGVKERVGCDKVGKVGNFMQGLKRHDKKYFFISTVETIDKLYTFFKYCFTLCILEYRQTQKLEVQRTVSDICCNVSKK